MKIKINTVFTDIRITNQKHPVFPNENVKKSENDLREFILSMRNPSKTQIVTVTKIVRLTQIVPVTKIVTLFWPHENVTIISGLSYSLNLPILDHYYISIIYTDKLFVKLYS